MSDFSFYSESVENATVTFSESADAGFPLTNIEDRNINTVFKCTAPGEIIVSITLDFGSNYSADHVLLGNYQVVSDDQVNLIVQHSANGSSWTDDIALADSESIDTSSYSNHLATFTKVTTNCRYWKISFASDQEIDDIDLLYLSTLFLGVRFDLTNNPELDLSENSGYKVMNNEAGGGGRFAIINNTTNRNMWSYQWRYVIDSEKTNFETFRDNIFMSNGLSRYPFYFTNDGSALYYARANGLLSMKQIAYGAYETSFNFEEEL